MSIQNDSLLSIRKLACGELSVKARLGYVALLLASAAMTVVIVSLWFTEPSLPPRTHWAFGAMSAIGTSWATLAVWALTTRRVLFARDKVIAGYMAVTFTLAFVIGALAAVLISQRAAAFMALTTGVLMLGVAVRVLGSARRRFAALSARRAELARMTA
ncbi:MAG: hypothetical protein ABI821_19185 [Pseudomonadota bacterium]